MGIEKTNPLSSEQKPKTKQQSQTTPLSSEQKRKNAGCFT